MHDFVHTTPLTSNFFSIAHEYQIKLALEEVAKSNAPNFSIIARKYNINRSTLSRRARGVIKVTIG